jgi:hypothetical protein
MQSDSSFAKAFVFHDCSGLLVRQRGGENDKHLVIGG